SLLSDTRFHDLLLEFDRELAERAHSAGCGECGGVLHSARYWRKPRGRTCYVGPDHNRRFSFCCARDGCRSRTTPPSLRFLARKVYLATIVVLVSMMQHGVTEGRLERLSESIHVAGERCCAGCNGGGTHSQRLRSGAMPAPHSRRRLTRAACRPRCSNAST